MAYQPSERIKNDGKDSESIFQEAMRKKGYAVFRLRDKRDLHGLNKRSVAAFGQPSDFIVVANGGAFLAEVKSSHNKTSFSFDCFTPAQKAAMAMCHGCKVGHLYVIYIHNMNSNEWYRSTGYQIVEEIKAGRKSIKLSNLQYTGSL
jgi:penicillin-binding protein-related factor A (putative recombinase)